MSDTLLRVACATSSAARERAAAGLGFQRFTVHALELRLLLHAAGARGEKFHITYTLLPPAVGDVGWRAAPDGGSRTATLAPARRGGGYDCVEWTGVMSDGSRGESDDSRGGSSRRERSQPRPCRGALLAMTLPPSPHWILQMHATHSYSVIDVDDKEGDEGGDDLALEVHCVGA